MVFKIVYDKLAYKIYPVINNTFDARCTEVLMDQELKSHPADGKVILYVGNRYDYGYKHLGLGFEHYTFFNTLLNMKYSLIYFDIDRIIRRYGSNKTSEMLKEAAYYYRPDYLFYFHFRDWIKHSVWKDISNNTSTTTIIWLADDHWRYEDTKHVWKLFDVIITTDRKGYERRQKEGFQNVIVSQWGCNHFLYTRLDIPKIFDVSFVGRRYGARQNFINRLTEQGVKVDTFGPGWKHSGRVSQSDLIKIYNQSKICLNISESSKGEKIQIKGRDFEVPGCGSLLLTNGDSNISEYFIPAEEIITYSDVNDAAEKIKYYLANEKERERVCLNGYNRVRRQHSMEKRFLDIFSNIQCKQR
jgi:spore maturation protein CgeB